MLNTISRILNNQFELNDRIDSGYYSSYLGKDILEDEKGKYQIKYISREVSCNCHPETCCHFDGTVITEEQQRIYLN
jgi:hypothetical protein